MNNDYIKSCIILMLENGQFPEYLHETINNIVMNSLNLLDMKRYKVTGYGNYPENVKKLISEVSDKSINEAIILIDDFIEFYVCQFKDYHGNISKDKSAWLCDPNDRWSVNFEK